jgi:AraC-like DNA-binding protein/mannose-6-phosphate isomerase-like protein (cupin superfamily)
MSPETRELLAFLHRQPKERFIWEGRIDGRRYLARQFPNDLPLRLQLQEYPDHGRLVGDNWMHWHEYYEFFVALSGPGQVRVGAAAFSFDTGDMVIVDPLKVHGVTRMTPEHTALVVHFPGAAVAASGLAADRLFLDAWERRSERLLPRLGATHPAAGAVHGALLRLCRAWFTTPATAARLGALKVHLLELLLGLRGALATTDAPAVEAPATRSQRELRLQRALEYISVHCHRALPQPEVARAAGMSTGRFRAFFKETTGWGFGDYLRDLRLDRAARLLRETDESIANIAQATGFADQSHLQRLFKLKHQISPRAYRQRHLARTVAGELFKK